MVRHTHAHAAAEVMHPLRVQLAQADSLAAHNLTRVAAHLCTAGAVDAGLLFSLLDFLTARCLIYDRHRIPVGVA